MYFSDTKRKIKVFIRVLSLCSINFFFFLFFCSDLNDKKEDLEERVNTPKLKLTVSAKPLVKKLKHEDCSTFKKHPFAPSCNAKLDVCYDYCVLICVVFFWIYAFKLLNIKQLKRLDIILL